MKFGAKQLFWGTAGLALTVASAAWGFGAEGHEVVAMVAESQLTPAAKAKVAALLAQEPGATLTSISTWADQHRSPQTSHWHFVDMPRGNCRYEPERDCPKGACVVAALRRETAVLASDEDAEERLKALKYVVHFTGDVHQPLHAADANDRGGNKFQVHWNNRGTNLHHIWDDNLIEAIDPDAARLSTSLEKRTLKHSYTNSNDPVAWAEESCAIASQDGFYPSSRKLGLLYQLEWQSTEEDRLEVAGQRLAALLNASAH
jgi:hypothetical protein